MTTPVEAWRASAPVVAAQRHTRVVLIGQQIVGSLGMGAAPSVGVLLAGAVTHSEEWAGLARTSSTIGAALAGIPFAALAVRAGRRRALAFGWYIAALGAGLLVAAAAASSVPLLIAGMLTMGVGSATGQQARFAATDLAVPARAGRDLSVVVWAGSVGAVLGPNLGAPGQWVSAKLSLDPLAGAFVIAVVLLLAAGLIVTLRLRPDPGLVAAEHTGKMRSKTQVGFRALGGAVRLVRASPDARLAMVSLVCAHAAMVALMTMTPVHLDHHGATITVVGLTISIHVVGMFPFAPVVGWLTDRIGPVRVICIGQVILLACAVLGAAVPGSVGVVVAALFALGLGWSFVTVPGAALLTRAIPIESRTVVQGLSDTSMNAIAALAAAASGPLLGLIGFGGLAIAAGALALPVVVSLAARATAVYARCR